MQDMDKEIHDLILNNSDYTDILYNDNRWDVLYNLSPLRENILEWYSFDAKASLLEIGAEFGALTSLFCRKVDKVVSLCENDMQMEAIVHRCRNNSNVQVLENVDDVEGKFDYITIINPKSDVQDTVADTMKFLKEDGKLIISCDNSLALKYFLDNEDRNNTVCVSKKQIKDYLENRDFREIKFYYPLPDFMLPSVIYSETYLPHEGDIRNVNARLDREKYQVMNEDYIYDAICDENIYESMTNSFLIIASR